MPNKVNKGEWAELFVFLKALSDGKIFAADERLNKIEHLFYTILTALNLHEEFKKEYIRDSNTNCIILEENGRELLRVPIQEFKQSADILLKAIQNGTGTFEIPEIEPLLTKLKVDKIKASNDSKKDIIFKIHDHFTGTQPFIGFSIKSYIGSKPTLLNASGATRIHYRCSSDVSEKLREQVHSISTKNKIKDRIQCLKENKVELIFDSLPNSTFERNLQMIDYRMPEILAYLFLTSYSVNGKSVSDVVKTYCQLYNEDMELVEYKVKDLLVAIALGMEPNSKWSGLEDANGGYIVVKEDGEILCYHIYDRNKLREYLYRNTKFDSPSSKRTGAGMFFSENEQEKFSLTVQIRF